METIEVLCELADMAERKKGKSNIENLVRKYSCGKKHRETELTNAITNLAENTNAEQTEDFCGKIIDKNFSIFQIVTQIKDKINS